MKILVPVDFSDITNVVLRVVKRIAEAHGGEVVLFHAVSPAVYIPYPESLTVDVIDVRILQEIEESKKKEAEEKLKGFTDFLKPVPSMVIVDIGDPRDLILEAEEKESPDLLVIGSHKKGLVEKILIGSTAEKVVKHSKKPVLVIKGSEPTFSKKVLIAYDFSKTAEKTVDFALKFLKPFKLKVEILHIDEPIDIPVVEKIGEALYEKYRSEKRNYVEKLKERFSSEGFEVSTSFVSARNPSEAIVTFVKENPDIELLMMGSRGLSGLKRILLGSTSTEVFRKVDIPILIYKEEAE
ncbi:universal stress protein [Hydrogenivirga sp. 128-5-R1-1]|uniref:universal stress protein n=1 Tax=Hydrogenivirga sp. 128-5-R1-1 TaxID=392423 RepID=UPI0002F42D29|nr:universal stress protein [Hydrogenivirga sp. 128-5-R1-1]